MPSSGREAIPEQTQQVAALLISTIEMLAAQFALEPETLPVFMDYVRQRASALGTWQPDEKLVRLALASLTHRKAVNGLPEAFRLLKELGEAGDAS